MYQKVLWWHMLCSQLYINSSNTWNLKKQTKIVACVNVDQSKPRKMKVYCIPLRAEVKPHVVKWWASVSPNSFCQFGEVFSSGNKGDRETSAVSDVRFTVADNTCGCPLITHLDCSTSDSINKIILCTNFSKQHSNICNRKKQG
jgi:hypothetical protein